YGCHRAQAPTIEFDVCQPSTRVRIPLPIVKGRAAYEKTRMALIGGAPGCQSKLYAPWGARQSDDRVDLVLWIVYIECCLRLERYVMDRADIVIVGGGFAGMCAARALTRVGHPRVIVLEARTGTDPRFRGELIHPPGVRVLDE